MRVQNDTNLPSSVEQQVSSVLQQNILNKRFYTHRQPMVLNKELFWLMNKEKVILIALINTIARERARIELTLSTFLNAAD